MYTATREKKILRLFITIMTAIMQLTAPLFDVMVTIDIL
jgi:hypothetical protein